MANSLQCLFQAIAQVQDERELRQSVMVKVGEYFTATRWGLSFLDEFPALDANTPGTIRLALSLDYNPVLRYLVERHAPVHEEVILPPGVWQTICPRADHGHVMAGPIIHSSQLVGGIAFTRHRDHPAFDAHNLADLSALCLHLSSRLADLRSQPVAIASLNCKRLTPREAQIVLIRPQAWATRPTASALPISQSSQVGACINSKVITNSSPSGTYSVKLP